MNSTPAVIDDASANRRRALTLALVQQLGRSLRSNEEGAEHMRVASALISDLAEVAERAGDIESAHRARGAARLLMSVTYRTESVAAESKTLIDEAG